MLLDFEYGQRFVVACQVQLSTQELQVNCCYNIKKILLFVAEYLYVL
jgi:hypothetical protein